MRICDENLGSTANQRRQEMRRSKRIIRPIVCLMAVFMLLFVGYGCDSGSGSGSDSGAGSGGSANVFSKGTYATTQSLTSGAAGKSGVFYPKNIAAESGTFPVFVFGCGAATQPRAYVDHGNMIASHGFIVIINASDNQGRMNTTAIDWIIQQNGNSRSEFYGKVNTSKIAAGGHSMGSVGTFNMANHQRLTTTVHVAGGSFSGTGSRNLKNPTIYISGTSDMALSNCRRDYQRTTVPVFFTVQQGVDHIAAAREGLPAIIAWLRWHLKGETGYKGDFLNPGGTFTVGKWDSQSKNW
jgi:hypothetical protein